MNVLQMEEEGLVTTFVPILLVHSSAVVSLVTISLAIVVLVSQIYFACGIRSLQLQR